MSGGAASRAAVDLPPGYERFTRGRAVVVALSALAPLVREAFAGSAGDSATLYDYARRHPRARSMTGRAIAYAAPLPDATTHVVVRHSHHGGWLAPLTGDRFLRPGRAPHELRTALRLTSAGVRTPQLVAYATYPGGPLLVRSDVMTREVPRSRDLAVALVGLPDPTSKREMLEATAALLASLTAAGARHPDLNLKNVLISATDDDRRVAYVLDVDRIAFGSPGAPSIGRANLSRLSHSARKWRDRHDASIDEADLAWLGQRTTELTR